MSISEHNDPEISAAPLEKVQHAFEQSRDTAREAARQVVDTVGENPLGVVMGGLVFGAVVAALIPRGRKERELLAPFGRRMSETATAAISAAQESGKAELEARGLTEGNARVQAGQFFQGLTEAIKAAGQAGVDAARVKAS